MTSYKVLTYFFCGFDRHGVLRVGSHASAVLCSHSELILWVLTQPADGVCGEWAYLICIGALPLEGSVSTVLHHIVEDVIATIAARWSPFQRHFGLVRLVYLWDAWAARLVCSQPYTSLLYTHCYTIHCYTLHDYVLNCYTLHCCTFNCYTLHCYTLHCYTFNYYTLYCYTFNYYTLHCYTFNCHTVYTSLSYTSLLDASSFNTSQVSL